MELLFVKVEEVDKDVVGTVVVEEVVVLVFNACLPRVDEDGFGSVAELNISSNGTIYCCLFDELISIYCFLVIQSLNQVKLRNNIGGFTVVTNVKN